MPMSCSPQGMLPGRADTSLEEAAVGTQEHLVRSRQRLSLRQDKRLCHSRARVSTVALYDSFQGGPMAATGADEVEDHQAGYLRLSENGMICIAGCWLLLAPCSCLLPALYLFWLLTGRCILRDDWDRAMMLPSVLRAGHAGWQSWPAQ